MFRLGAISGSNAAAFNPDTEVPSLDGKVILVTGGSAGLGKQAIVYLARHNPSEIWLTARTKSEAEKACVEIREEIPYANLKALQLNLASFLSIKEAAATLLEEVGRLDVLMLNAGIMGTSPGLTEDGYEIQFGVNYLGHALLTKLLLPLLNESAGAEADVRVIVITSYSHWNAPEGGIVFDALKTTAEGINSLKRYAQSKLANILFVRQLAKEYPNLTIAAIHPGAANTTLQTNATDVGLLDRILSGLLNRLLLHQPVETVAKHQVWAATTKDLRSGEYYEPLGLVGEGRPETRDNELAKKLWDWTMEELRD